jgi:hypothetical protein
MKFGVDLISFGPSARPDVLARWAMLTETLGYHFLMTFDHIALTPDVAARYPAPSARRAAVSCKCASGGGDRAMVESIWSNDIGRRIEQKGASSLHL